MVELNVELENLDKIQLLDLPGIVDIALKDVMTVIHRDILQYSPTGERDQTKHVKGGGEQKHPRFINQWSSNESVEGGYSFSNPSPYALVLEYGGYPGIGPRTTAASYAGDGEPGIFSHQTVRGMTGGIIGLYLSEEDRIQAIVDQVARSIKEAVERLK